MGAPMGTPMGAPMGPPMGAPMGYDPMMGPPVGAPMGTSMNTNFTVDPLTSNTRKMPVIITGKEPVMANCNVCNTTANTLVDKRLKDNGLIIMMVCCAMGCFPCALFPLCDDSYTRATHRCGSCHCIIATVD